VKKENQGKKTQTVLEKKVRPMNAKQIKQLPVR